MAGALVRHPQGDLLIDAGFGRNINDQFRTLPWILRVVTPYASGMLRLKGHRPLSVVFSSCQQTS
jgi:hypothetical protein